MFSRADLNTTRPAAAIEAPAPVASSTDARQEVFHRLSQLALGRQFQAEVISAFDDGTFLVRIADTAARMALPAGIRAGDEIPMTLVAKEPRPTFLLNQEGSAPASLSPAARMIDQLVQAADQEGAPAALAGKTPLLAATAAPDPKLLAAALHDSLEASGLFYESHVHEWLSGARPQADLGREPQAQFSRAPGAGASPAASLPGPGDGGQDLMDLIRDAHPRPASLPAVDADVIARTQTAAQTLDPESARMVGLQLHTLEQQHVRWQGELRPGQPMEWEVREDKNGGGGQDAQQASWTSVVRFQLPALGDISATLRLSGDRLQVQIGTGNEETAATLRSHGGLLADALEAAGSQLESLQVKRDEAP